MIAPRIVNMVAENSADEVADRPLGVLIGAGRSGKVLRVKEQGIDIARKVFDSDRTANMVHYVLTGAPNPYTWNEDAIYAAYYRRKILQSFTRMWFGDKVSIAAALDCDWNTDFSAYQLDTAFVTGRPVALCQPFSSQGKEELHDLLHNVMKPLQQHLQESGFEGIVWQAGKGNPVALNNFLLVEQEEGQHQYVGIDLESGVPALFPLNPLTLFSYYLPKSFKHKAALFDDVDTSMLKAYLQKNMATLTQQETFEGYEQLVSYAEHLETHQIRWRSLSRIDRALQYQYRKGRLSQQEVEAYQQAPLRWYSRESLRLLKLLTFFIVFTLPLKIFRKLKSLPILTWLSNCLSFVTSEKFRLAQIRNYLTERIGVWQERKQLNGDEAMHLKETINRDSSTHYLNDFSVHLGIKVLTKFIEFLCIPALLIAGLIDEKIAIIWFVGGGPVYRTSYTLYRMAKLKLQGKPLPWLAFWIGMLPTIGDIAYPCQSLYIAGKKHAMAARFIVYDFVTRVGEKVPIWGGKDTQTEHFFNSGARMIIQSVEKLHK